MRQNVVAWVAVVMSGLALASSYNWSRTAPATQEIPSKGQRTAKELGATFGAIAEFVQPSVVQIVARGGGGNTITQDDLRRMDPEQRRQLEEMLRRFRLFDDDTLRRFFDEDNGDPLPQQFRIPLPGPQRQGTGSGFVYDEQGHILTNNHVVENANQITVIFSDGRELPAEIVGTDSASDVAIVKVESSDYRPVLAGNSDQVKRGEWVMAFGAPFNLSESISAGIISGVGRGQRGILDYEDFIQTDAAINPGNSGGPLVDMNGRVIGMNTAILTRSGSSSGVGFAIPMNMVRQVADILIENGEVRRARIGILLGELSPDEAESVGLEPDQGLRIREVVPGSPGAEAGLEAGDILVQFDDYTPTTVSRFRSFVSLKQIDRAYEVVYIRGGQRQTTQVTLGAADEVDALSGLGRGPMRSPISQEIPGFGISVQPMDEELAQQFGIDPETKGLIITSIDRRNLEELELRVGDVITNVVIDKQIRSEPPTIAQLQRLARRSDRLTVRILSLDGTTRFVTLAKVD